MLLEAAKGVDAGLILKSGSTTGMTRQGRTEPNR
jgi:hypothetical protein